MSVEKIQDIDAYRNTSIGGTWSLKSGETYEAGVTSLSKIAGFAVLTPVVLHALEDSRGNCLAEYGLSADETLIPSQIVTSNRRFPFTKIVLSAGSGQIDLVKEM